MLKRLLIKQKVNILGINSGTSADGLDLAVIKFGRRGSQYSIEILGGTAVRFSSRIKAELEQAITSPKIDAESMARLDIAFGRYLGRIAKKYLEASPHTIDLIASHGQTIGHFPTKETVFGSKTTATVQIGDGNAIACESGLPVVSDFRRTDIALGGEGAPLTPFINQLLFGRRKRSVIVVNIGGIANYSFHPTGADIASVRGGDCGPGNTLIDNAAQLLFNKPFDRNGILASKGTIVPEIVKAIVAANKKRGISTGRELFDRDLLARLVYLGRRARADSTAVITSITDATSTCIHASLKTALKDKSLDAVYLTGGGRKNLYIVKRLAELCRPVAVLPIEALGYDGDLLEAVSFAVLGGCFLFGIPSTLPHVTGAAFGGIAGRLSVPPQKTVKK